MAEAIGENMSGEDKVPSVKERIQQKASGAHKTPEELKAETTQRIAKEVFNVESPITEERRIAANLERDKLKAKQAGKLQLLNMSGGHLANLIVGIWTLMSVTAAVVAMVTYYFLLIHIEEARKAAPVPAKQEPVVVNVPPMPETKPPQLFVFLPGKEGTKTIRVEGINPATWPDEVRIRLSDMEALKSILKELKPPDPPKAAPPKKKARAAKSTQVQKGKDGSEWLPPPRDVVPRQ